MSSEQIFSGFCCLCRPNVCVTKTEIQTFCVLRIFVCTSAKIIQIILDIFFFFMKIVFVLFDQVKKLFIVSAIFSQKI